MEHRRHSLSQEDAPLAHDSQSGRSGAAHRCGLHTISSNDPHDPPLRFPRQSPQSATFAAMLGSTGLRTSATRNSDLGGPGHELPLVLSQVWRPHGCHREINRRSDPTPLSPQAVDGRSMKSLSHFENFARSAAVRRLLSCPEPLVASHALSSQCTYPCNTCERPHCSTRSSPAPARPSSPTCSFHSPTASAANASGFLLSRNSRL